MIRIWGSLKRLYIIKGYYKGYYKGFRVIWGLLFLLKNYLLKGSSRVHVKGSLRAIVSAIIRIEYGP